uniref:histidine--tRNA ligase n=1 Tax=Porphyridium sordidum TaxID=28024 RepID=A0A1C9CDW8_PORSO|nr:histidine-tRNA synthetase [Porphyridium sordidum]AOM66576.1 histidine-tRNA synthetase [Porphyridium sordidum]
MNDFIKCPRGTKDILPFNSRKWHDIESEAHNILASYGYEEVRTPIFEETKLFERGIGEDTDVVNKEMYSFIDQGNRQLTLRPEGTAGVVRCLIENQLYKNKINRLWYYGPMFRYERPQSGRQRQFHQLGIECIGSDDARADFEIISIAWNLFCSLKIDNLSIEINSIGDYQDRAQYVKALSIFFRDNQDLLDEESISRINKNPLRILDSKNPIIKELIKKAPMLPEFLGERSKQHFNQLCKYLSNSNIPYIVNPRLVRGLDYYTYTAFEIKAKSLGAQDTICGGGRYNNLIQQLGGPSIPAVGCGIGIERLLLIYNRKEYIKPLDFVVISLDEKSNDYSIQIFNSLQSMGFNVQSSLNEGKVQKQLKKAIESKAKACIIVGEREINNNIVNVKWLKSKENVEIKIEELRKIKKIYSSKIFIS